MGHSRDPYYDTRRRSTSGTALRDQWGNLLNGEFTGVDQYGQGIPMGQRPLEQGLHSGTLSTGAPTRGPSAFDEKFGKPQAPPTRTVPAAPGPIPAPAAVAPQIGQRTGTPLPGPVGAPATPLPGGPTDRAAFLARRVPGAPASAAVPAPAATAPARTVPAPDAFGARRTNMTGQVERWQPSETTGTGKWVGGAGIAPSQVALPANPADRALLMETRKRDAMDRQPEAISIPGGDPAARAWNTARGTGHASTPEPGAVAPVARPDAFSRPMPALAVAAGTGQQVQTPYGTGSSTMAKPGAIQTPAIVSNTGVVHPPSPIAATAQAMPAGVTPSAQMRNAATPTQAPAASISPPPAPAVGMPSRQSLLTGGNPPPLTVAPTPMTAPAPSLMSATTPAPDPAAEARKRVASGQAYGMDAFTLGVDAVKRRAKVGSMPYGY